MPPNTIERHKTQTRERDTTKDYYYRKTTPEIEHFFSSFVSIDACSLHAFCVHISHFGLTMHLYVKMLRSSDLD